MVRVDLKGLFKVKAKGRVYCTLGAVAPGLQVNPVQRNFWRATMPLS